MIVIFLFIIGLCLGSFVGVVIDRIPKNKTILYGRSQCDRCHHTLSWMDLVPVVSFLFLKGKCRYCGTRLSWEYPYIEIVTALLVVSVYTLSGSPTNVFSLLNTIFLLGIILCFFALCMIDMKYGILPDTILFFATVITVFFLFLSPTSWMNHILSALAASLFFFLLIIVTKGKGMGMGDGKLAFLMGFFLGFPQILIALYIAFLTGSLAALILVVSGKKKIKGGTIPFGPFLIFGTFVSYFWGNMLWQIALKWLGVL